MMWFLIREMKLVENPCLETTKLEMFPQMVDSKRRDRITCSRENVRNIQDVTTRDMIISIKMPITSSKTNMPSHWAHQTHMSSQFVLPYCGKICLEGRQGRTYTMLAQKPPLYSIERGILLKTVFDETALWSISFLLRTSTLVIVQQEFSERRSKKMKMGGKEKSKN